MSTKTKKKFVITIGADPEFFLMSGEKGKEEPVMACGKFGGQKGSPVILTEEGGFLEDGTAIELNLSTSKTLSELQKKVFRLTEEFEKRHKVKVSYHSSQRWNMKDLQAHPEAMNIGCAPDRYAYGLRQTPSIAAFKDRRFAGGHIHVGIDPWPDGLQKVNLVRYFDLNALAPYVMYVGDVFRFPHYGYPGLYRETGYGIEWRSPDNFWCNSSYIRECDNDRRQATNGFIQRFDESVTHMSQILEAQGNGAAFNQIIEDFLEEHGLPAQFSAPASRRKTQLPSSCRSLYPELGRRLNRLLPPQRKNGRYVRPQVPGGLAMNVATFEEFEGDPAG